MSKSLPPQKISFSQRREREFLYLKEIDAIIAAVAQTRAATRNTALALLLFCQALQPLELCYLKWEQVDFAQNILSVFRTRTRPNRYSRSCKPVLQSLCSAEVDILQQLHAVAVSDWLFASERQTRLSERSLRHIIQLSGTMADLPFPIHAYMLRNTGLYYRSALLLQGSKLSLRQCCLLWNRYGAKTEFTLKQRQEYSKISRDQKNTFLIAVRKLQAFTDIQSSQNLIDYLLGAYLLFPKLEGIPPDYWLAPTNWCL